MQDQFFTPSDIAEFMVSQLVNNKPRIVADFSAGHGELLNCAARRWPKARIVAADIDPSCVQRLRKASAEWRVCCCDFLKPASKTRVKWLAALEGKVCTVLMNPPFSGRGSTKVEVELDGEVCECSRAMGFVVNSRKYLRTGGELIAILPASVIGSQKDRRVVSYLQKTCALEVLAECSPRAFKGCVARTVVVRMQEREFASAVDTTGNSVRMVSRGKRKEVLCRINRGCLPVHKALERSVGRDGFPFFHSTNVVGEFLGEPAMSVSNATRIVRSPSVIVSRVGNHCNPKCAVVDTTPIVLSDCLIAIECDSYEDARTVRNRVIEEWSRLSEYYTGTCAPYITIASLKQFLATIGVQCDDVRKVASTGEARPAVGRANRVSGAFAS